MSDNKGQFRYAIHESLRRRESQIIAAGTIDDPFLRSVIRPKGWRAALAVFLGRAEWRVHVDGTRESYRVVFRGDYTPDPPGPPVVMGIDSEARP